uniref:Retroviral polymerase SH3-like domain-containing protein n=1 Tax=Tanacetum cinerariifolium TaxID=118510 RepID=A0A699GH75_TANCI|nr:hypothetical protein [Tanacetum cinerariifolium]
MPDKLYSRSIKFIFVGYPKETIGYYFYYPLESKHFVNQNAEFFENSLTLQEASGSYRLLEASRSDIGLKLIQEDDTQPYENTSKRHDEVEPNMVESQSVEVLICRSIRISQAPDRYGLYVDAEEHKLGDLNEPPNYKAALSDLKFNKWLNAMNTEMQSMKYNQVCSLVDLPPNNIRAIRILLAIFAFYDYEIWQMDAKTAFLNDHLKYIAVVKASMEAVWMRKFIDGLGYVMQSNKRPMEMLRDNAHAIEITNDPEIMRGARHYQRKYHYIRKVIQDGEIILKKVHTNDNLANPFTKPTPYNKHFEHAMGISVCLASSLM